jgi:peroxiredoxin
LSDFVDNVNVIRNGFFAPDFSLPDAEGNLFNLKQNLQGCFTCICFFPDGSKERVNNYLKDLNQGLPATGSALPVRVVGICSEKPIHIMEIKEKLKLGFPILSDKKTSVANKYYILDHNSLKPGAYFGIFIIDDTGIIRHRIIEIPGVSKYSPEELRREISRLI